MRCWMHNPAKSQHPVELLCPYFGGTGRVLWGLEGVGTARGVEGTRPDSRLTPWQSSGSEEAENAWTEPSPGRCCSGSFVSLPGSSLHFLLFFLRTILEILVWFSPVWIPVSAGINLSGGAPSCPSWCLPGTELPPTLTFSEFSLCFYCFSITFSDQLEADF